MRIFTQFDDELRSLWPETTMPFYSFAWHKTWFDHFGANEQLSIIEHGGYIAPLAIREGIAHFTGGEEIADYLDIIIQEQLDSVSWNQILGVLHKRSARAVRLCNIPEGSSTLTFFNTMPNTAIEKEDTTPILTLPENFEAYLASLDRKKRHEVRRKMRRFEEEHQDITLEERTDIDLLITLMQNDTEKQAFLTPDMKDFFRTLPTLGLTRQFVLTLNGKPVATTLTFEVEHSLLLYNSGYTIEGSGWYLKVKLIEWAIKERFAHVNFLQGGERYKYDFGAKDFLVYRVSEKL
ncbi:MAG TPA: GNAT family N-acetyltransferase [Patescibacteria group bacterium]|nr:GNAT family N-acetyltransferase [Patescibacteria group bacterium]